MKKMMKSFRKSFLKKSTVFMLAGTLLCSQSLTAEAAMAKQSALQNVHTCAYSIVNQRIVKYLALDPHTYYDGTTEKNPDGSTSLVPKSCLIVSIEYAGTKKCACGNVLGDCSWVETTHSRCGQAPHVDWK